MSKINIMDMEMKFFPKDVLGFQPKKVGDSFSAMFFGSPSTFVVTDFGNSFFMAKIK